MRTVSEAPVRAAELDRRTAEWQGCQKCALARTRTQVVVGSGHPNADLMFVGEAPGYHEDRQGAPFVGQAGKVLESLLGSIGLSRPDVYIANVLKCRPPGNRDPQPDENPCGSSCELGFSSSSDSSVPMAGARASALAPAPALLRLVLPLNPNLSHLNFTAYRLWIRDDATPTDGWLQIDLRQRLPHGRRSVHGSADPSSPRARPELV